MTKKKIVKFTMNHRVYPVILTYKKMKRMYLRVNDQQQILISCPLYTREEDIAAFLQRSEGWIAEQLSKKNNTTIQPDMETIDIFGKTYPIRYEQSNVVSLRLEEDALYCCGIQPNDARFSNLFYHEAAKWMIPYLRTYRKQWDKEICEVYQKPYPKMTLKYMTSRWGSCTPARSHIRISVRLIHYPLECLQYVLLHEYVHLLVPNHSKQFYDTVERYMPDWKKAKERLK